MVNRMKKLTKNRNGFTLLELMMVVAIIGVLAAIALPLFGGLVKRSKTSEAKSCLGEIRTLQEAYSAEYDTYIGAPPMQEIPAGLHTDQDQDKDNMADLGFHPKGFTRYAYGIDSADSTSFTANAEGNLDKDGDKDKWEINESSILSHTEVD